MSQKVSVKFFPYSRKSENGHHRIMGRITVDRKKAEFSTDMSCVPKDWDKVQGCFTRNHSWNEELTKLRSKIFSFKTYLELEEKDISARKLKELLQEKEKLRYGLIEYFNKFIDYHRSISTLSESSISKYEATRTHLENFLREKKALSMRLNEVDHQLLSAWDGYLTTQKSEQFDRTFSPATVHKHHVRFKTLLLKAFHEGQIRKNPYAQFKLRTPPKMPKYLTEDELKKIKEHDLGGNHSLQRARDVFVFSCYTGLRYQGAQDLTLHDLQYDPATDKLLKTEDINGFPMQYTYDKFYRMSEVWSPVHLFNSASSATLKFEYFPYGIDPESSDPLDTVPVAITSHNINDNASTVDDGLQGSGDEGGGDDGGTTPQETVNCDNLISTSGRPEQNNPLRTATFMDGMQRVIQVKKDASQSDGTDNQKVWEVSGFVRYDWHGRKRASALSDIEPVNTASPLAIGRLYLDTDPEIFSRITEIDYMSRPLKQFSLTESGVLGAETAMEYAWGTYGPSNYDAFGVTTTSKNTSSGSSDVVQTVYTNSWGQQVAQVTGGAETRFEYNLLNELEHVWDPLQVETQYQYDHFGRMVEETHNDRGTTEFHYDMAGNLTKKRVTDASSATTLIDIVMTYDFNRLEEITYPESNDLNGVVFTYGALNDGANGAGRVTSVVQGGTFKTETYKYDYLGNRVYEQKVIEVPRLGALSYTTTYMYDPWGRVLNITLPDDDKTSYVYNDIGDLERIFTKRPAEAEQVIIDDILYDGFGNIEKINYGNGTETSYSYDDYTRRMDNIKLDDAQSTTLLNKSIWYDDLGNVNQISNIAGATAGLGGHYTMEYMYDDHNRLEKVNPAGFEGEDYLLEMEYNAAGGILLKHQDYERDASMEYKYDYAYHDGTKPHQINTIKDLDAQVTREYKYDSRGNISEIILQGNPDVTEVNFVWSEENRLTSALNNVGLHHYVYDQNGQRILKGSVLGAGHGLDSENQNSLYLDAYTVYVNPYFVDRPYINGKESSKHYYMGTQRVSSAMYLQHHQALAPGYSPAVTTELGDLVTGFGLDWELVEVLEEPLDLSVVISQEDYEAEIIECATDACRCEVSPYWAKVLYDIDCDDIRIHYWYHPDYLGNTEFITNASGRAHQFFFYSPWGEALEVHSAQFGYNSPYRFNSKEWDGETGNYYMSARYYNPKTSIWLSVDPLATDYPSWSPYNFTVNNPVNLIDPTGMGPEGPHVDVVENEDGTHTVVGGELNEDQNIYVVTPDGQGGYERTGEILGQTLNDYDFFKYEGEGFGEVQLGAVLGKALPGGSKFGSGYLDELRKETSSYISGKRGTFHKLNALAVHSFNGATLDIKGTLGFYDGYEYSPGVYTTGREMGNILFGANMRDVYESMSHSPSRTLSPMSFYKSIMNGFVGPYNKMRNGSGYSGFPSYGEDLGSGLGIAKGYFKGL